MVAATLSFLVVIGLLTVTPGADTALVVRAVLAGGRRRAFQAALGICTGCFGWGLASALGITALLELSKVGFLALRLAGAAYLGWVGINAWRSTQPDTGPAGEGLPPGRWWAFRTGLVTNLLNPKVGIVYLSLLPGFIPAGVPVLPFTLFLVALHAVLGVAWLSTVAALVDLGSTALRRPRVRRRLERATGAVLVGLGVSVAASALR